MPKVHQTAATFRSPRRRTRPSEYWLQPSTSLTKGEVIISNTQTNATLQSHAEGPPFENHARPVKRGRERPPGPSKRGVPVDVKLKGMQSAKKRRTRQKSVAPNRGEKEGRGKRDILVFDLCSGEEDEGKAGGHVVGSEESEVKTMNRPLSGGDLALSSKLGSHHNPGSDSTESEEEGHKEDSTHVNGIGCACTNITQSEIGTSPAKTVAEGFDKLEPSATTSTTFPEVYFDALETQGTQTSQGDVESISKRQRDDMVMQAASEMVLEVLKLVDVFVDRLGMEGKAWP